MLTVLGLAAAILSTTVLWPQVRLSCGRRRTQGLSPAATWLAVALNADWLVFAALSGNGIQALTHVVVGAGNTAVLVALLVTRPDLRTARALGTAAAGAAAPVLAAVAAVAAVHGGADTAAVSALLGTVAGAAGVAAAALPPLRLLCDTAQDTAGIAPARWRLAAVSSLVWTAYGAGTGETVVWLSAALDAACALSMCALLLLRRPVVVPPRRRCSPPPEGACQSGGVRVLVTGSSGHLGEALVRVLRGVARRRAGRRRPAVPGRPGAVRAARVAAVPVDRPRVRQRRRPRRPRLDAGVGLPRGPRRARRASPAQRAGAHRRGEGLPRGADRPLHGALRPSEGPAKVVPDRDGRPRRTP